MIAHKLAVVEERGRLRAICVCGWRSLSHDKTHRGCGQAYIAHCYAAGLRTSEDIRLAGEQADADIAARAAA